MHRIHVITAILLALLCAGCAAPSGSDQAGSEPEEPSKAAQASHSIPAETEDHVLLTQEATVENGRVLRLEAVGKKRPDMDQWGVREVQVYDDADLIQTILAQEAIDADGISGAVDEGYTDCWSPDEVLSISDMNFDGSGDIDLFGWVCNNTIPYYYWLWDSEAGQYRYSFTLQGAEAHPGTGEVLSSSKSYGGDGPEGGYYHTDYYRYNASGALTLIRRDVARLEGDTTMIDTYQMTNGQWVLTDTKEALDG